jgi:hypothetical protein
VEAEEVEVCEVTFNRRREIVLVDLVKDKVEVY